MLLRFRVSNFASLRDEQELSLIALDEHPDLATTTPPCVNLRTLPAAGIFGANASGKSHVIKAIEYARDAVRHSHQRWLPDDPIPRRPFRLDDDSHSRPSQFVFDLVVDEVRYTYGFALDDAVIQREWLHAFPNGRRQVYFERYCGSLRFGNNLTGHRQRIADAVRPSSLFVSAGAANNHPQLGAVYRWFGPVNTVSARGSAALPARWQSTGTETWLDLLGCVLPTLDSGGLLLIDGLGNSLYPLLVAQPIRLFHDPATNPRRAQLLFTSHSTGLLGCHQGVRLARDQIWLTEKDQHGATRLFPLTDFRVRDDLDDVEGRYLKGRYGAVPFFDDTGLPVQAQSQSGLGT